LNGLAESRGQVREEHYQIIQLGSCCSKLRIPKGIFDWRLKFMTAEEELIQALFRRVQQP
jgi:hypothetical protein